MQNLISNLTFIVCVYMYTVGPYAIVFHCLDHSKNVYDEKMYSNVSDLKSQIKCIIYIWLCLNLFVKRIRLLHRIKDDMNILCLMQ